MLTTHPSKHTDSGAQSLAAPASAKVTGQSMANGREATTEVIQRKYALLFESARQACQAHSLNGDHRGVVRESTWMCRLDDALVDDICALTGTSVLQAQPFRNLRRSDIELFHEAARQGGNAAACLRAEQLMQSVRAGSLRALSDLAPKAPAADETYDERFRDYGCVVADLDALTDAVNSLG